MNLVDILDKSSKSFILKIRIIPNSSITKLVGIMDNGVIKIKLTQIPEKGKANQQLIKFIAKELEINRNKIKIINGVTSQNKTIKIDF